MTRVIRSTVPADKLAVVPVQKTHVAIQHDGTEYVVPIAWIIAQAKAWVPGEAPS